MLTLIADVDDTVCPSTKPIGSDLAREIARLVNGGCAFAFISGSNLKQISDQLTPFLGVPHHLLPASGTQYVKVEYADGKPLFKEQYRMEFSAGEQQEILAAFEALIAKHDIRPLTSKEDQLQDRGSQITLSILGRNAPEDKKRAADPDGKRRREWLAFLRERLGDKYSMRIGGTTSIDITPKGIDKAYGIRRFLEANSIKPSEALFFGDKLGPDGNDFPATQVVDCIEVRDPSHTLEILSRFKVGPKP
jgi:HAD superfamily hydrolase (TIGR01484 family)